MKKCIRCDRGIHDGCIPVLEEGEKIACPPCLQYRRDLISRSRKDTTPPDEARTGADGSEDDAQQNTSTNKKSSGKGGNDNGEEPREGSGTEMADTNDEGASTTTYVPTKEDSEAVESLLLNPR